MQKLDARRQYVRWLVVTRSLSAHTVRAYDGDLGAFAHYIGCSSSTRAIDRDQLIGFLESQRDEGLTATTIKRRASGVRGFCRWLMANELLEADPFVGLRVTGGRGRKLPRLVPDDALDALLATLQQRAGIPHAIKELGRVEQPHETTTLLAVALMVATGVRVNELVSIRCHDIDLVRRTIRIMGKGRRERQVYLTNDWIVRLAVAYLEARARLGVQHHHLLFNRRCAPLTAPAMRSRLAKVARDASLGLQVTPHMLRHSAATRLVDAGVDIRLIQTLLGHASLTTTEIYTHVSNAALQRVLSDADVLGRALLAR
ncbi:MAG: hypothetical protein QOJ29_1270 [Thermoleophilaceae bacterium]|nr:hypothetical protein [Thermoleophilaceae bacterium]